MFPRVVRLREETADPLPLLLRTLLGVIALAGAAVAGLFLLGEEVLPIFFGEEYTLAASLAWQVGLACLPFAVVNVLLFYNLTRASNRFLFGLGAALLLEIAALRLVPATPAAVCTVLGTTGSLLLVALVLPGVRRRIIARGAEARS
jgi:O-antigen/teichoic acid export membrane protein